ncbi:MAG: carbonic anhydrase family protein [Cyclobacteriaceae bacterium]
MNTQTAESQAAITPKQALTMLKEGNKRFVQNLKESRDLLHQVEETSIGQYPFAVVLSCIDSRVPAEIVFDQGIGDIFSIRIAGNFVNEDILGSMEFGCKAAGSKLILVLGHTSCGAVKGVCNQVKLGNLTGMLAKLQPAVDAVEVPGERNANNAEFVQKVSEKNVELTIQQVKEKSPVLKEMLDQGEIDIVGGMYNVATGQVEFYA